MDNFRKIGVCMSVKIHFLRSDLDYFQENCGDFIEEQGERVHRDISDKKKLCQGWWYVNFPVDYYWYLKRDVEPAQDKRKSMKRSLIHE